MWNVADLNNIAHCAVFNSFSGRRLADEIFNRTCSSTPQGADWWNTVSIPRLGIPNIKCSDGPNGVRGSSHYQPVPAHCIPCATALAASFDVDTAHQAGQLLALEARAKGSSLLLGPTCNIQRNPLNGRVSEVFHAA